MGAYGRGSHRVFARCADTHLPEFNNVPCVLKLSVSVKSFAKVPRLRGEAVL